LSNGDLTADLARTVAAVPGVATVDRQLQSFGEVSGPSGKLWSSIKAPASDPRLEPETLSDGRMPEGAGEIAVPEPLAETLGAELGTTVQMRVEQWTEDGPVARTDRLTVTGLLDEGTSAFLGTGGVL